MPLYEYRCQACGQRFEVIRRVSDPDPEACARCGGGPVERQLSSPAIQFKGSGWYITDYARKGKAAGEAPPDKGGDEKPAKSDSGSAPAAPKPEGSAAESTSKATGGDK
jgi:putative FmdB family regulatory protein